MGSGAEAKYSTVEAIYRSIQTTSQGELLQGTSPQWGSLIPDLRGCVFEELFDVGLAVPAGIVRVRHFDRTANTVITGGPFRTPVILGFVMDIIRLFQLGRQNCRWRRRDS